MNPRLISLNICPFVQRSVITLLEKKIDFDVDYLSVDELNNPPEWFQKISPFHKVPVLCVGDTYVFESAVINEYLDETHPPSMHPQDPLQRALNRSWIKFAEEVLFTFYYLTTTKSVEDYQQYQEQILHQFRQIEAVLGDGPFFNSKNSANDAFCLVDAAFAPAFMRIDIFEKLYPMNLYSQTPKLNRWADACRERTSVSNSVPQDFEKRLIDYSRDADAYIMTLIDKH